MNISTSDPLNVGSPLNISVYLYNARGELYTSEVEANIFCKNNTYQDVLQVINFSSGYASKSCYTPNDYNWPFNITVNVSDLYNNTGGNYLQLTTVPKAPSNPGTKINPPMTIPPENCTDKIDNDKDNKTDCDDPDCYYNPACTEKWQIPNFTFSLLPSEIGIRQGENGTVQGTVANTGDIDLLLISSVDIDRDCCIVETYPNISLPYQTSSLSFPISVHVKTSTPTGEYFIKINLNYSYLQNSQGIKVVVEGNTVISRILEQIDTLANLVSRISEYQKSGLDMTSFESSARDINETLQKSFEAIQNDSLDILKQYEAELNSKTNEIQIEMDALFFNKMLSDNKWGIAGAVLISIFTVYVVTQVLIPLSRISFEIRRLRSEQETLVRSRFETEKQYFTRKIDEKTYRDIATGKQSQITKLIAKINLDKEARRNLLNEKFNPLRLLRKLKRKSIK